MGIADLVPGISGGTIAFITGIYERLIKAIKGFSYANAKLAFKVIFSKERDKISKIVEIFDLGFLFLLFFGVFSAIFLGANIISYLLDNYFIYVISLFVGLILASSFLIYREIKIHSLLNFAIGLVGLVFGLSLLLFSPISVIEPSFFYILFGGFIAIAALFLPGISGSFILLILGLYEFMINVIKSPFENLSILFTFGLGAIFGAFFISRFISFIFEKDKCKTLYFLVGLVIGSLTIPIYRVLDTVGVLDLAVAINLTIMVVIGIILVLTIDLFS